MRRVWKSCLNLVLVGAISGVVSGCGDKSPEAEPLVMFCAAGIKTPVSRIAAQYEAEYGVRVQLQYGGSGTLLTSLKIAKGDIYLAADSGYTQLAKEDGLLAETLPVGLMKAGFGVAEGNPKGISQLADLRKPGVKIGIGNPAAASIGKFTKKILSQHGLWEGFEPTVLFPTVNELANAQTLGAIDVAVLWDAVAHQHPEMEFVSVPEFDEEIKDVTVGVLTSSDQPEEALRFCRYLNASDKGQVIFEEEGFIPIEGDKWAESSELALYSGAMLRPAIQASIKKFEGRERGWIHTGYHGCGVLAFQMNAEGGYQPVLDAGNVMPGSATGDCLVNQVRPKALANPSALDDCDVVAIDRSELIALQSYAVGQDSVYPPLMNRFLEEWVLGEGKESFLEYEIQRQLEQ